MICVTCGESLSECVEQGYQPCKSGKHPQLRAELQAVCPHTWPSLIDGPERMQCLNCLVVADRQTDGSYLARGKIKSVNVSITIGGVKAPEGPLLYRDSHVPIAQGDVYPQDYKKCARCGLALHRHEGRWAVLVAMQGYDAVCRATPEQKAHPLKALPPAPDGFVYHDEQLGPVVIPGKPCNHSCGVVLNGVETRCAGCHQVVGRYLAQADPIVPSAAAVKYNAAREVAAAVLKHPLSAPEYGVPPMRVDLTPEVFGKAIKEGLAQILPPQVTLDEAMASMGYVPTVSWENACKLAKQHEETASRAQIAYQNAFLCAQKRGDLLQKTTDEKREIEAENSRLRRRIEQLERKK
jgi:hypothetical protein